MINRRCGTETKNSERRRRSFFSILARHGANLDADFPPSLLAMPQSFL
jgi:hypothetical protein